MLLIDIWANLAANGPVCGVEPRKGRRVLHAVTYEAIPPRFGDKRTTVDAPCGKKVRIMPGTNGPGAVYMWPPRIASLPEGWTRCAECHEQTGRRRPHPAWVSA